MRSPFRWAVCARIAGVLALAGVALMGIAGPAIAHEELIGSTPEQGAVLEAPPSQVELRFSRAVAPGLATVTVTTADRRRWEAGPAQVEGSTVTAPIQTSVTPGRYTVGYRVVSSDGHPVTGSISYELTDASSTAPSESTIADPAVPRPRTAAGAAAEPRSSEAGPAAWPWVLGGVLLIGLGVIAVRRFGRA